jgi:hypothetical protein
MSCLCHFFETWLPSLNLAAKFELGCQVSTWQQSWQPSSNFAGIYEGTRGKHTETKKLGMLRRAEETLNFKILL